MNNTNNEFKNNNRKSRKRSTKKAVIIVIAVLLALIAGFVFAINNEFNKRVHKDFETVDESGKDTTKWKESDTLNVLILGLEDVRTDMMMVVSYNPKRNDLNIISIPRDTYVEDNSKYGALHKINSLYGASDLKDGPQRVAKEVSKILGIPINQYVLLDYDGVRNIVDAVGGVDIDIPFNMYYDDPSAKPPLHVYFQKGPTTIMGDQAVEYLRWRKNSDGTKAEEGDVGRIRRQQEFVLKAIEKSLNPSKIQPVVNAIFDNVETSLNLKDIILLAKNAASMKKEDMHAYQAIGLGFYDLGYELWFFDNDVQKNHALMDKILNGEEVEDDDLKPSKSFTQRVLEKDGSSVLWNRPSKSGNISPSYEDVNPIGPSIEPSEEDNLGDVLFENGKDENQNTSENEVNNESQEGSAETTSGESGGEENLIDNNSENQDSPTDTSQGSQVSEPDVQEPAPSQPPQTENPPAEESPIF